MSATITSALKMTAERIALEGEPRRMTLSAQNGDERGSPPAAWNASSPVNIAGRIEKYLATSLATENVVSAPRVISSCLPISTISISFLGLGLRYDMFP